MKHAYLIMAHHQFELLTLLVSLLDDERNDIYIHIDSRSKSFLPETIVAAAKKSQIYFTRRIEVNWGSSSQILCELTLLEMATNNQHYDYYHLLTGQDLPIKSQNYIHEFFSQNRGKEFVRFQSDSFGYLDRVKYYWFIDSLGRGIKERHTLAHEMVRVQRILGVSRVRPEMVFQKGTNRFSITDNLARYVISQKDLIQNSYRHTLCCDEVFLQTLIVNSSFVDNLYWRKFDDDIRSIMRLIRWKNGTPHTFTIEDLDDLMVSEMLFALKFDLDKDDAVVEQVRQRVLGMSADAHPARDF
jgi:core-2/I-Branching enzyme